MGTEKEVEIYDLERKRSCNYKTQESQLENYRQ